MVAKQAWGDAEKAAWLANRQRVRSYEDDVISRIQALPKTTHVITQYGALAHDPKRYPLFHVTVGDPTNNKPTLLVTGGVHGYEPSGVEGALILLEEHAASLSKRVNLAVFPCGSPWGYEHNERWNRLTIDPNRHFKEGSEVEECAPLMRAVVNLDTHFRAAIDLHETPDRDIQLRRERALRDGGDPDLEDKTIPNGYYLYVVDRNRDTAMGRRIIDKVRTVTKVCDEPTICGAKADDGIIYSSTIGGMRAFAQLHADEAVTTEVYPDPNPAEENNAAQIASIQGALEYVLEAQ